MKKSKGFTLVELIITIAVIAVLAAIVIIALPKVIDSANEKSALSDASNTLRELRDMELSTGIGDSIIIVTKGKKTYLYGYYAGSNELVIAASNPYSKDATLDSLKKQDVIEYGEDCSEVSTNLSSTKVYENCRLTDFNFDVNLNTALLGLTVDESFALSYELIQGIK